MPVIILGAVLLGLAFLILSIVTIVQGTSFLTAFASVQPWIPDWYSNGSVLPWIVTLVALLVSISIAKAAIAVIRSIIITVLGVMGMGVGAAVNKNNRAAGGALGLGFASLIVGFTFLAIGVVVAFMGTTQFLNYTDTHSQFTTYFTWNNWFAIIGVFMLILGVVAPTSKSSKSQNSNSDEV